MRKALREEQHMDKWVFLFGAGASYDTAYKLPLMKGFFKPRRLEDPKIEGPKYAKLLSCIKILAPGKSLKDVNLEEFVTHLDLSVRGVGANWFPPDSDLHEARRQLDVFVRERLRTRDGEACQLLERIFGELTNQDTLITLNYDLIVDRALQWGFKGDKRNALRELYNTGKALANGDTATSNPRPHLQMPWPDRGVFLKLHGSIDWGCCANEACPHGKVFDHKPGDFVWEESGVCPLCGNRFDLGIVPPTMGKTFDRFPVFGIIWRLALRELSRATHLVVIGVSFAESDHHLRWLIREAARRRAQEVTRTPKLWIANPSAADRKKCEELFGCKPAGCYRSLQALVKAWPQVRPPREWSVMT